MEDKQNTFDDLEKILPLEQSSIDLWQFDKKEIEIESATVGKVKSIFATNPDKIQWVLNVRSKVVTSTGEGDDKIEFRATDLFNLTQDDNGKLTGYPTGEGSNLIKFLKDIGVREPGKLKNLKEVVDAMVGKKALIKCINKIKDGKTHTFMKFRY